MADGKQGEDQLSDVKASFAWGQLFAGSLIGGLAVWKLLHKMTNTEPSEWFVGLSRAYEEVRDFVMLPFDWINFDLTESEKNILALCIVLIGAIGRAVIAARGELGIYVRSTVLATGALLIDSVFFGGIARRFYLDAFQGMALFSDVRPLLFSTFLVSVALSVIQIPLVIMQFFLGDIGRDKSAGVQGFVFKNILFTVGWGTVLLLLNWATS
jgi:hypothetical protein